MTVNLRELTDLHDHADDSEATTEMTRIKTFEMGPSELHLYVTMGMKRWATNRNIFLTHIAHCGYFLNC